MAKVLIGPVVKAETIDAGQAVRAQGVEQLEAALAAGWLQTVHLTAQELGLMQRLTRPLPARPRRSRVHRAGECEGPAADRR